MRKFILLFVYFFLICYDLTAQSRKFVSFVDFLSVCRNTDSLEKVIAKPQISSKAFINNLIWLEMTYRDRSIKFGSQIERIGEDSKKLRYELGTAMYCYLKHIKYFEANRSVSLENLTYAHKYFLAYNDISGLLRTYYSLARINVNTDAFLMGDKREYLQNAQLLFETGKEATLKIDKLFLDLRRLQMSKNLNKKVDIDYYEKLITSDEYEHPDYSLIFGSLIYEIGRYYSVPASMKKSTMLMLESVERQKPFLDDYSLRHIYYSIAVNYFDMNDFIASERYIKKVLEIYDKYPTILDATKIGCLKLYYTILYKEKKIEKAWVVRNVYDSLDRARKQVLNMEKLSDLQQKYASEKREYEIEYLKFENKIAESQNEVYKSTLRNKELQAQKLQEGLKKNALELKTLALEQEIADSRIKNFSWWVIFLMCSSFVLLILFLLLIKANKDLKELQKDRYKLDTIIAHDLRSPFNTYQRYSEIIDYLVKTKQYDRIQETAKHIEFTGSKLALLIDNLLNWSMSMQQNIHEKITKIQIISFFDDLLPLYIEMANFKKINLKTNIQNCEIESDINMLSVIIRNLLDNAIKYTNSGQDISLDVECMREELILKIKNNCSEMTESQKIRIANFIKNPKPQSSDDIGIGLQLIKQYTKKMKASIEFNYRMDFAEFEIKIPKKKN